MACSGSHCSNHGTGTSTCAGHRASCATNRPVSFSQGTPGGTITSGDVNALRVAIRDELSRYRQHRSFTGVALRQGTAYTSASVIDNSHINELELMAQQTNNVVEPVGTSFGVLTDPPDSGAAANAYADAQTTTFSHWNTLVAKYDVMRQDCICNADCACNLVCACHNDCGCNYSDERLKEEIEYC
jgi:hypothetical protein